MVAIPFGQVQDDRNCDKTILYGKNCPLGSQSLQKLSPGPSIPSLGCWNPPAPPSIFRVTSHLCSWLPSLSVVFISGQDSHLCLWCLYLFLYMSVVHISVHGSHLCPSFLSLSMIPNSVHDSYLCRWFPSLSMWFPSHSMVPISVHGSHLCPWLLSISDIPISVHRSHPCLGLPSLSLVTI